MARVRFTRDFDYRPTPRSLIGYIAGTEMTVRRECAVQAIAAGKAVEVTVTEGSRSDDENSQSSPT